MLATTSDPLCSVHDLVMLDLDGVVYVGDRAVPGAPEALSAIRARDTRVAFITNNAARSPEEVAQRLASLGVEADATDVVTSAQAAARVLAQRCGVGARVAVLGGGGLRSAIQRAGLLAVAVDEEADAVVSGFGPDVPWRDIMRAAVRIKDGLPWVASNADLSLPTDYGQAPGHGVLVETLRRFSGVEPVIAGKPAAPLFDETIRRCGGERPLMVGDRLDTDIAGARAAGLPSLLVLTGVTGLADLVAAPPDQRPTYLAEDLGGVLEAHEAPLVRGDAVELGGWSGRTPDGVLQVDGAGVSADWWRVAAATAWRHLDATGTSARLDAVASPA
ncbi:HAD-IIA family hydrolase [Nocardioides insulae]|uniref:HAD-IIA family hydrolase n=1 Tax=Nocardioides insulae TaxID=394734 RepID=UPI0005664A8E|nr:HAD-IIA family hydrolase [Nocardioides insulae]